MTSSLKFLALLVSVGPAFALAKTPRAKSRRPASIFAPVLPDYRARALLRKQAPFVVEERTQGQAVRIDKDGTFTRAPGANGFVPDGKWKVLNNRMRLRWNDGTEREYSVGFLGTRAVIDGRRANKKGTFEIDQ